MAEKNIFDLDSFQYDKGESYKNEPKVPIPVRNLVNEPIVHSATVGSIFPKDDILDSFGESLKYEKDWGKEDPYLIVVICEDKERTYNYLCEFISQINDLKYTLYPVRDEDSGIPFPKMVEKANIEVQKKGLNFDNGDVLFLVSDLDHYRASIEDSVSKDDWNNQYQLIISNPCIEIWFYYHFKEGKPDINAKKIVEKKMPKAMKTHNNTIVKGGVNHLLLANVNDMDIAIENSKRNFSMEENGIIPSLFSTQMHIVAEKLKEAMV